MLWCDKRILLHVYQHRSKLENAGVSKIILHIPLRHSKQSNKSEVFRNFLTNKIRMCVFQLHSVVAIPELELVLFLFLSFDLQVAFYYY